MNKIKSKKLKKNLSFLKLCLEKDKIGSVVSKANYIQRKCLYEILLNVVNRNIPVNNDVIKLFQKQKKHLKLLINRNCCEKKKKKIINQTGKGAILPLIIAVLPSIIEQIINRIN